MNKSIKSIALAWLIANAWISIEAHSATYTPIQDTKIQIDNIISSIGDNKLCQRGRKLFYHDKKTNTSATWVRSGYWIDINSDGDLDFFVQENKTHELRSWEHNYNWRLDQRKNVTYKNKTKYMDKCVPTNNADRISKIETEIKKVK